MSYNILYRGLGITIPNQKGAIVVIEVGSNNVYTNPVFGKGKWKRSRNWQNDTIISKQIAPITVELVQEKFNQMEGKSIADKHLNEKDLKNGMGWFWGLALGGKKTWNTTKENLVSFYRKAIVGAKTIEEWRAVGVGFEIRTTSYPFKERRDNFVQRNEYIKTTEDLVRLLGEYSEVYLDGEYFLKTDISPELWERIYPKKTRGQRLSINKGNYVVVVSTSNGESFAYDGMKGRKLIYTSLELGRKMSERTAQNVAAKLNSKSWSNNITFTAQKITA